MNPRLGIPILVITFAGVRAPAQDSKPAPVQSAEWNQWLGPNRDDRSPDKGLIRQWPDGGPKLAWTTAGLGQGFSAVSFAGKRIFTAGDVDGEAKVFALDRKDGKILWSARLGEAGGRRKPGPRSTPSTDGKLVFALGQDGSLVCADAKSGKVRWRKHMKSDFGGRMMSGWGYSESPLLDGDLLVCCPGGRNGTVIALKKNTGKVAWRCEDLTDPASYCSLVPVVIGGVRQYIVLTNESLAGIAAKDGELLWRADRHGKTAVCSTPVYHDGYVFVSSDYGVGCNAFKVTANGKKFTVEELYAGKQLLSHHGGMVLVGGHVYALGRRNLKCIELATGDVAWEAKSVGKGSITYADGNLIVRSERGPGTIALVEATPDGYKEKGRFNPPERTHEPSWAYPVVFGGRLYIRDQDTLVCYDLQ